MCLRVHTCMYACMYGANTGQGVQERRKEPMREQRDGKLCGKQGGEDKVYGLKNGIRR